MSLWSWPIPHPGPASVTQCPADDPSMPGWNPLDLRQHIVVCGIRCYRLIPYDNVLPKSQVAMKGNDNQKNRLEKKIAALSLL